MEQRDLVVGCITGYGFEQIRPWVVSLESCGFAGDRAMIVYDASFELVDELVGRGFLVVTFERDEAARRYTFGDSSGEQILVSRFFHIWCLLSDPVASQYRYVISADVKDLVFQTDPSRWLEAHLGERVLNAGSESVRFEDEPWGDGILARSFEPMVRDHMRPRQIYNAGTLAGTTAALRDFALQVYLIAAGRPEHPDQASANLLLSLEPFRSLTRFSRSEDGWACQAGTSVAPSYFTGAALPLLEPSPSFDGELVRTASGQPFCLVHQYDRVPEWREAILRKYSREAPSAAPRSRGRTLARPGWRLAPRS